MEALGRDGGSPGLENRLQDGDWGVVYTVSVQCTVEVLGRDGGSPWVRK